MEIRVAFSDPGMSSVMGNVCSVSDEEKWQCLTETSMSFDCAMGKKGCVTC